MEIPAVTDDNPSDDGSRGKTVQRFVEKQCWRSFKEIEMDQRYHKNYIFHEEDVLFSSEHWVMLINRVSFG